MSECRTVQRYTSNAVSFTPKRKVRPSLLRFSRNSHLQESITCQKPCTNFHGNQRRNMETAGRNTFTPLNKVQTSIGLSSRNSRFLENSYTEFHENSSKLFSRHLSHRRTDGLSLNIRHSFLYFVKNAYHYPYVRKESGCHIG